MALRDITVFGEIDRIDIAIKRLREFEPDEGYYLAFSGGKDSQCIYHLALEAGVKFDAHYNLTTIDPPELVWFIREKYPDVVIDKPKRNFWQLVLYNGSPPLAGKMPYCCRELKHCYGSGRVKVLGNRSSESTARKTNRRMFENCHLGTALNPIIDWELSDVWEYIKSRNLPYCSLYDEGYTRLGCLACCKKNTSARVKDLERYPRYKNLFLLTFSKLIKQRKEKGLRCDWETPEEIMDWWIYGKEHIVGDPDQTVMFE